VSPSLKKLPIGIQTFREIIEEGYVYVDKTAHALALASTGKYYFLSRSRRFGKSPFIDKGQRCANDWLDSDSGLDHGFGH
jgi:hypothetical protein